MKVTRKHRSQVNRRHRQLRSKLLRVERLEARYALTALAAPVAVNDFYSGVKDTPLVVGPAGVLTNDSDADLDPLSASLFSPPSHGSVSLNADGSFTYTPTAGYTGLDGFLYSASDGALSSKLAAVTLQINATGNVAPVANPDSYTIAEDGVLDIGATGGLLTNDTDANGDPLTAVLVSGSGPTHGSLTLLPTGAFHYVPDANFNGTDQFSYKANDGALDSDAVVVTIDVTPVNDAPIAVNDEYTTNEDTALVIAGPGVLGNDTDAENDPLTPTVLNQPQHGTLTFNPGGGFTYTPAANYNGPDGFSYYVSDGTTTSGIAAVSIDVTPVNDPPVAVNDPNYSTAEDTPLVVAAPGVLANDTDVDGDSLTVSEYHQPAFGTVTMNPDGSFTYTPAADYFGPDSFTYKVSDGLATSAFAAVTIAVNAVNDPPVANPDTAEVAEDSVNNTINVLGNDKTGPTNESSQTLTVTAASAANGTVTVNGDGTLSYTPAPNYNGPDTITYTIQDDGTTHSVADPKTAVGTVAVNVTEVNDAPVANADNATVAEDSAGNTIDVLGNDTRGPANEDSQTLTVIAATAANGTVTINGDGTLSYTPAPNYNGPDTITYTITDDGTTHSVANPLTAVGTVAVNVTAVNDAPVAGSDSATVAEDSTGNTINVLDNDSPGPGDEIGQTLTVIAASAANGTVTINGDGTLSYTPAPDFNGPDTITYTIQDDGTTGGAADPKTAVGTVAVTVTEVNDAPVANPDTAEVAEDSVNNAINVLGNDTRGPANEDSQTLTVIAASAANGSVTINGDGTLSYTPAPNFNGPDTITYTIQDDGTTHSVADPKTAVGTVAVNVTEVNDAPVANADNATVAEDSAGNTIDVLANDIRGPANEDSQILTVISATAANGTVTINGDGTLSYTPAPNFNGPDTITYTIQDNGTTAGSPEPLTAVGTVAVTVTEVNDPPVPGVHAATVDEDSTNNTIDVLSTDKPGPENESSQLLTVSDPHADHGTVTVNGDGTLSYTPAPNYNGPDTITYTIRDDGMTGGSADPKTAVGTVAVTVTAVNDAPVGANDLFTVDENATLNIPASGVLANDTDVDGDTLSVLHYIGPVHGTFALNPDGSLSYTPAADYHGVDGLAYQATDGTAASNWTAVTIVVRSVNNPPVAVNDSYSTSADTNLVVSSPGVLANDTDADGDGLTATIVTPPDHGTVTLQLNGSFVYEPAAGYAGPDSFVYAASDGFLSSQATVSIAVTGANQAPLANNDSYSTTEGVPLDIAAGGVLGNDTDPNSDPLTAILFASNPLEPTRTAHGTITLNTDGSFVYTPDEGFAGSDFFLYSANDGLLSSSFAAVTIDVAAAEAAAEGESNLLGDSLLDVLASDPTRPELVG